MRTRTSLLAGALRLERRDAVHRAGGAIGAGLGGAVGLGHGEVGAVIGEAPVLQAENVLGIEFRIARILDDQHAGKAPARPGRSRRNADGRRRCRDRPTGCGR